MGKSDFSKASDDQAPAPVAFSIAADVPAVDADQQTDDVATVREAAPYWHPAWEPVQDKFEELLKTYGDPGNAVAYKDLPADEFKIRMLAEAATRSEIEKIMEDVKNAVESVEQSRAERKQQSGTKKG